MKWSTHNQANIQALRSDMRFDALVKKQETEHQHIIASHHKEMQVLRDSLRLAIEKSESLSNRNHQQLEEFKIHTGNFICFLKDKIFSNESSTAEQKKTIEDLHKQLNDFHIIYSSKIDLGKFKDCVSSQVKDVTTSHLFFLQELQREFKELLSYLKNDFIKFKTDTENKFIELVDLVERNFTVNKIDREGVLKEIRTYEKTIFIIEKKIENIYTLIERMNKRGEVCHKPE